MRTIIIIVIMILGIVIICKPSTTNQVSTPLNNPNLSGLSLQSMPGLKLAN